MIQEYLMNELKRAVPGYVWTVDFRPDDNGFATVFSEGGIGPDNAGDLLNRRPRYQVYLSSKDWDDVATAAELVYEHLRNMGPRRVDVPLYRSGKVVGERSFYLWKIDLIGEPNDLGMGADNVRDFSINFEALLTRIETGG